jgi:predicted anti-sigma-YlaC factor YlaD
MVPACDPMNVESLVDGELPPEQAHAVRLHLADCTRCQAEFEALLQLQFLSERHRESGAALRPVRSRRARTFWDRRRSMLMAAACLSAVFLGLIVLRGVPSSAASPYRATEARLDIQGEGYKPQAPATAGATITGQVSATTNGKDPIADHLLRDERHEAELALKLLEQSPPSLEVESRQAMAWLRLGKPYDTLKHTDAVLKRAPGHAEASWNRGLALRDLRLKLAAARAFTQIASLKEPGWAEEAAQKAADLRSDVSRHRERWSAVFKAGQYLLDNATTPLPEDFVDTPIARLFFYDAVRAAPNAEAVRALLPLAQALDERTGGTHVLEEYVQRVSAANFEQRGPVARAYANLVRKPLSSSDQERVMEQILSSQEDDLILGALVQTGTVASHLDLFMRKVAATKDPWFQLVEAQERAAMKKRAGRLEDAVRILREALPLCERTGLEYRCLSIQSELSTLFIKLHEFQDARQYAEKAWQAAREHNEWRVEQDLLWSLSQIARLVKDTSLSQAYLEEYLEGGEQKTDNVRRVHENLAALAFQSLQIDEARREIDAALGTGLPLSPSGALALAEIARMKETADDEKHILAALENPSPPRSPGERAVDAHTVGRFFIERDVARGREWLERSIQQAAAPGLEEDRAARRARAYSFTSLILDAGRRGAFNEALTLFSRERGQSLPERCLLAATADSERTLLIVRGSDARVLGWHDETRREPLPERLEGLVQEELLAALQPCERVDVLARPPLHGRVGLLPLSMAWSYLTRTAVPSVPRTGAGVHLIVSDVEIPPGSEVPTLPPWHPSLGRDQRLITRSGADATPSRVLAAMKDATEIDVVAHGFVYEHADASYLLLSSEGGNRELTLSRVRATRLRGAPFVVLAACHAAHTSYALHDPLSLPAAFVHAGARGVVAATEVIPIEDANAFFNQVRERMRTHVPPAIALRDVRVQWLEKDSTRTWLASVLLFE